MQVESVKKVGLYSRENLKYWTKKIFQETQKIEWLRQTNEFRRRKAIWVVYEISWIVCIRKTSRIKNLVKKILIA